MMEKTNSHNISGNVVFIILIAVALFGALSYAVTQGFSGANANRITKQQAKAAATAIIKYATDVEQAITRLQLVNDCSDEQISFERHPFDGSDTDYINLNAPSDFSCHVFHPDGGAVPLYEIPAKWIDPNVTAWPENAGEIVFTGDMPVALLGQDEDLNSSSSELTLYVQYINTDLCTALNKAVKLNLSGIPTENVANFAARTSSQDLFKGSYDFPHLNSRIGSVDFPHGRSSGCFARSDDGSPDVPHAFFHVLIAR
jgi:type II secretory pathway pseudopilin PulG